jgi:hypothetical protein
MAIVAAVVVGDIKIHRTVLKEGQMEVGLLVTAAASAHKEEKAVKILQAAEKYRISPVKLQTMI